MESTLIWVMSALVVVATAAWMGWTLRQARIARTGPSVDGASYLQHDKAVAAVAACAAVTVTVLAAVITRYHPLPIWPGAIIGILVIVAGERRWPRPSGDIRSAAVAQRRARDLVPRFSTAIAVIAVAAAGTVIAVCWMLGNSPGGRSISGNVAAQGSETVATVATVDGFPGWPIGLITVLGAVAMLAALAAGWRFVARRPALQGVSTEIDRLFRRSSVDRMMRIVAVAALVTTSEWYETARAAYERLHWKTDPMALPTGSPFPWVPGVCLLLTLIVLVTGTRPRLTRTTSSAPQVGQPA